MWCLAAKHWLLGRSRNGWAGRGALAADVPGPLVEIPALGAARRHSTQAHGVRIPPRAKARKQAPRSTPSHAFPWTWAAKQACRGVARNLGDRPDGGPGGPRPFNPLHRRQPMPTEGAGKVGLWPIFLQFVNNNTWLSPRFESEITCACIAPKDRVQIGHILRPHNPPETACKEPESCARTA